ncbi:hypothetical protein SNEBB_002450 [Seison nebaliae]|nr:hypothetical protein SNEBB_002450 [Seison nebaliae]
MLKNDDQAVALIKSIVFKIQVEFQMSDELFETFNPIFRMAWETNMTTTPLLLTSTCKSLLANQERDNFHLSLFGMPVTILYTLPFNVVVPIVINLYSNSSRTLMYQMSGMLRQLFDAGMVHACSRLVQTNIISSEDVNAAIPDLSVRSLYEQIEKSQRPQSSQFKFLQQQLKRIAAEHNSYDKSLNYESRFELQFSQL